LKNIFKEKVDVGLMMRFMKALNVRGKEYGIEV